MAAIAPPITKLNMFEAAAHRPYKDPTWPHLPPLFKDKKSGREYRPLSFLGAGAFGRCYSVVDKNNVKHACKVLDKQHFKNPQYHKRLINEIDVMRKLPPHPHIVNFVQCFEDSVFVYIVMELCNNDGLDRIFKNRRRLTEPEVRYFMYQLADSVEHMHKHRVIHRDLKFANILLTDPMRVKVADFGLSAMLISDKERKKSFLGTPNFLAPEVVARPKEGHSYEVDIWALGVVMYSMLYSRPPFHVSGGSKHAQSQALYHKITNEDIRFPDSPQVSRDARYLMAALLTKNPDKRPNANQIKRFHFFSKYHLIPQLSNTIIRHAPDIPQMYFQPKPTRPAPQLGSGSGSATSQTGLAGKPLPAHPRPSPDSSVPDNGSPQGLTNITRDSPEETLANQVQQLALGPREPTKVAGTLAAHGSRGELARLVIPRRDTSEGHTLHHPHPGPPRSAGSGHYPSPGVGMGSPHSPNGSPLVSGGEGHHGAGIIALRSGGNPLRSAPGDFPPVVYAPTSGGGVSSPGAAVDSGYSPDEKPPQLPAPELTEPATQLRPSPRADPIPKPLPEVRNTGNSSGEHGERTRKCPIMSSMEARINQFFVQVAKVRNDPTSVPRYSPPAGRNTMEPRVFMSKWVDISVKYGLGYELTNNSYGVHFNDNTTLLLLPNQQRIEHLFYDPKKAQKSIKRETHTLDNYPMELKKKVTLLLQFRRYMRKQLHNTIPEPILSLHRKGQQYWFNNALATDHPTDHNPNMCICRNLPAGHDRGGNSPSTVHTTGKDRPTVHRNQCPLAWAHRDPAHSLLYLNKFIRTKYAAVFRISHGVLQLNFIPDHSKLVLQDRGQIITYIAQGKVKSYSLDDVHTLVEDTELLKRLKYAKDVLSLINTRRTGQGNSGGS
ncbi:Cell cycle serine/threonine-protein kinase cdc5/MSD2 [Dispira simplex]|nr:Cell cycle serine/threonine-protein kinase cdc5/MSD2 [Dispira simplex]